jgi:hypothetical protein
MYKAVLTHRVAPGKLAAIKAWFKEADEKRAKADPKYVKPKRYATVFGNESTLVIEFEIADETALAKALDPKRPAGPGGTGSFYDLVVPGMSEWTLLKDMEL